MWAAAAASAARAAAHADAADARITVISPTEHLVIRPRLYEAEPKRMRVPLDDLLAPIEVVHVSATVTT